MNESKRQIVLKKLAGADYGEFKAKIQESFGIALANFENAPVVPSDEELMSLLGNNAYDKFMIYSGDEKIGGAVIFANHETGINTLELFFMYKEKINSGLGVQVWERIERHYPDAKIWQTVTPYFEKRNINFYVNKCGFKIVEFCNKHHKSKILNETQYPPDNEFPEAEDFFVFQKILP